MFLTPVCNPKVFSVILSRVVEDILKISEILRVSTQGCSQPFLCKDEKGDEYWCKGVNAGLRSVRNEWICANVAKALGLPVPNFAIAKVPYNLFSTWKIAMNADVPQLITESNPFVFASLNVAKVKDVLNRVELASIERYLQAKIVLFDAFIRNLDRSEFNSNLLVTIGLEKTLYIIDHNLAFDEKFDKQTFLREHILRESLPEVSGEEKERFWKFIGGTFSEKFLEAVWNGMPDEWVDDEGAEAHKKQVQNAIKEAGNGWR